jgi:hypothetical protein
MVQLLTQANERVKRIAIGLGAHAFDLTVRALFYRLRTVLRNGHYGGVICEVRGLITG